MRYDENAFGEHFKTVKDKIEPRRRKYVCKFLILLLLSAGTIAAGILYFDTISAYVYDFTELVYRKLDSNTDPLTQKHEDPTIFTIVLIAVVSFLFLKFAARQFFYYKGSNRMAGMLANKYSLKDDIYSRLVKFFGDFDFAPNADIFYKELKKSSIIPQHSGFYFEDYFKGVIDKCSAHVLEANLTDISFGQKVSVFRGLVIMIDSSEIKVKLRQNFAGKSVIIADAAKEHAAISAKYSDHQRVTLPVHENTLEAYTTNADEFKKLATPDLLTDLVEFQDYLNKLEKQHEHSDDKIKFAFDRLIEKISLNTLLRKKDRMYDARIALNKKLDVTKSDKTNEDVTSINNHVQLEIANDKVLITIPVKHDLFEPSSLFVSPINDEDMELLFKTMNLVGKLTAKIDNHFKQ